MPTKVKLRQKAISGGRQSLYLDIYPPIPDPKRPGKKTRREFLNLYIFDKPKTPIDKRHNTETLQIGRSIRQKRENFLNKPEIYSEYEKEHLRLKEQADKNFISYFESLAEKRTGNTNSTWKSALLYLKNFYGETLRFGDLNVETIEEFKDFLLSTKSVRSDKMKLAQNTSVSYFGKIKAALKQAYKDNLLSYDLNGKISPIKEAETRRDFLTLSELEILAKVPCSDEVIKRAAIFSALTSLAHKEISNLVWGDITYLPEQGYEILTKRQKTERDNYLPISEQAYGFTLGQKDPRDMPSKEKVFKDLKYSSHNNKIIAKWIAKAKIDKKITFHCFRHTYATLQLYSGTDIYTVSKMMGHKDLKTTQIYAKIVDSTKREAADKIKLKL